MNIDGRSVDSVERSIALHRLGIVAIRLTDGMNEIERELRHCRSHQVADRFSCRLIDEAVAEMVEARLGLVVADDLHALLGVHLRIQSGGRGSLPIMMMRLQHRRARLLDLRGRGA